MSTLNRLHWIGTPLVTIPATTNASFGKGIEPRNLRLCEHGATHISLAGDWAAMAQELQHLGNVMASTLNDAAILTQRGRFPSFELCPGGRFAVNGLGGLGFDFAEWRRVWATRRPAANGICRSLAIVGHDNSAAHHVVLLDDGVEETFAQFARRHQGEPPRVRPFWPARGEGICTGYHERFRTRKWEYVESASSGSRRLAATCLPELFESALAARLRLTTTLISAPVIQSALWTPTALEHTVKRITVTSDETQLRLQRSAIAEVWSVPPPAGMDGSLAVELYDAHDRLFLGLSVTPEDDRAWNQLIGSLPSE